MYRPRSRPSPIYRPRLHSAFVVAAVLAASVSPAAAQSVAPIAHQFDNLHFRSIGPAIMSGRITDFAVFEKNPSIWYVATAHGGVWKTTSNGALLTPIWEDRGLMSIGDVTVSQSNPDVVWVGTGESNNRQSTSWGDGVFKSTDGGKTFRLMGLVQSKHINRIVIDPSDENVVFVAATGPLFGPGGDRGVYKSIDGGMTWTRVLGVDENTGANDLVMSPTDPKTLYASTYERRRTACCVNGGGRGSGIWKSTDGGENWTRLTNGVPSGPLGRIGLDVFRNNPNILYASIEAPTPLAPAGGRGGAAGAGRGGAEDASETGLYRSDDAGATWHRVTSTNPRPLYFSQVRIDPANPDRVYMGGVKMQLTVDGGKSVETSASLVAHDDIHAIWIDPANPEHLLIGGDGGVSTSYDGAKTWQFYNNLPVGLFYHVNYDLSTPYNVCGGMQDNYDWCGPSRSRESAGIFNDSWFQIQGGDGFVAIPDRRDPRWIYSETQDGNIIRRNKVTGESKSIRPNASNVHPAPNADERYRWNWDTPMIISPNDPSALIVAANRVFISHDRGDSWTVISPDLTTNADRDTIKTLGERGKDIRIAHDDGISAWPTIVSLAESPKVPGVYYTGTDDGQVSVSRDGGKTWTNVTKNLPDFPAGAWISEVVPSRFDAGTVYVTVDNHRVNDYNSYVWVSTDYGKTFKSLVNNLDYQIARTLTEDQRNPDVLYLGTETGIVVSLDRGHSWQRLQTNLPDVRIDEITLHPRDNAMLVATHGRALWILDHLEPIQEYAAAEKAAGDAKLFTPGPALEWKNKDDRNDEFWGHAYFIGENPPSEAVVEYDVKKPLADPKLRVSTTAGRLVREIDIPDAKNAIGIQSICWDFRTAPIEAPADSTGNGRGGRGGRGGGGGRGGRGGTPAVPGVPAPVPTPIGAVNPCDVPGDSTPNTRGGGFGGGGGLGGPGVYVTPGTYTVALVSGGKVIDSKPLTVVGDPDVHFAAGAQAAYTTLVSNLHELQRKGVAVAGALNMLYRRMPAAKSAIDADGAVPAGVKEQFESLNKDLVATGKKFGVPFAAATGGRGGRGAPADPADVLAHVAALKNQLAGVWESPSASMTREAAAAQSELPRAIAEANALLTRAAALSRTLKGYGVTLTVPPVGK